MKSIERIGSAPAHEARRARVAAYCRVSKESETLDRSFANQVGYYSGLIQSNPEWEYAGVYADHGISGLRTAQREGFKRLMADCEDGKVDIVLTKSISRFARNTLDLLRSVRRLKELGVDVRFEREGVRTLSAEGEVMLTLLASFAQQESESISENVKWGIRKKMRDGLPHGRPRVYGYEWVMGALVVREDEAEVVRRIFREYVGGASARAIARGLDSDGVPSREDAGWSKTAVAYMLENRAYIGDLHLQKSFVADPVSGTKRRNRSELPQYIVEGDHEPIVEREVFDEAQRILARWKELGWRANGSLNLTCLSGAVKCGVCGKSYVRGSTRRNSAKETRLPDEVGYWTCATAKSGRGGCGNCKIRDDALKAAIADALGTGGFDEEAFERDVRRTTVHPGHRVVVELSDGTEREATAADDARKGGWTEARRAASSRAFRERSAMGEGRFYPFTTRIRCAGCGADFRHRINVTKSRGRVGRWTHSGEVREGCALFGLDDERLESVCAEMLGAPSFDGDAFMERVERIDVDESMKLTFAFKDGTEKTFAYGRHGRGRAVKRGGGAS